MDYSSRLDRDAVVELVDRLQVPGLAYLMLLIMLRGVTVGELILITHGDRGTVQTYLRSLELRGFVVRVQSGHADKWFPSENALSLMRLPTVGNPDSCVPTTATALLSDRSSANAVVAEVAPTVGKTDSKVELTAVEKTLKSAGIGRNLWAELTALPHVTVALVKAHDKYRRARGESTGLLITRLRCGDAAPKEEEKTDKQNGADVCDEWDKFLGRGKYARKKR